MHQYSERLSSLIRIYFLISLIMLVSSSPGETTVAAKAPGTATQPIQLRFDFGPGKTQDGFTQMTADMAYTQDRGYGFEETAAVSMLDRQIPDALKTDCCTSRQPFLFSADVPEEGNYRVTLILGGNPEGGTMFIKAESRRLMLENIEIPPDKTVTRTIIVNVRNSRLPGNDQVRLKDREIGVLHWDDRLTLEFNGKCPSVCAIVIEKAVDVPTIFLAGDSTVTDQTTEPWTSWGQMLTRFFKPDIAIANYAESGETLRAFVGEKRLAKLLTQMKAGDYLFVQFAHNDMKRGTPEQIGYPDSLRQFINEARSRGAFPVLVTSMHRRQFDNNGKVVDTMQGFPEAMKVVAREENVPLIDLHAMSRRFYEAMGPVESAKAFVDGTHHNAYGAYELAKCIVEGIKNKVPSLTPCLVDDIPDFDPGHPDPVDTFDIPASPMRSNVKPEGS